MRKIVTAAFATLALGAITACGKQAEQSKTAAADAGSLNIYIWSAYLPQEVIDLQNLMNSDYNYW